MKLLVFLSLFVYSLQASQIEAEAIVPQVVIDAIQNAECLKVGGICTPNFIRINNKGDTYVVEDMGIKIKGPIIKCENPKTCSDYVERLVDRGVDNIDLGPYQINFFWQNSRWSDAKDYTDYFKFETAEIKVRQILGDLISRYGYNWRTLGRYHHFSKKNPKRNRVYYKKLYKYIYGEKPKLLTRKDS